MSNSEETSLLTRARRMVDSSLDLLESAIERSGVELKDKAKYNTTLGSHVAYLSKHAVMILSEVRKLEAHDRSVADRLTQDELMGLALDFLRDQPDAVRLKVVQYLTTLGGPGEHAETVL
jgi:uncharacterized protein YicC (UPF0701 family)